MKISIYLEDNLLDTNEDSIIALTLCYSYVEDPTTIAGDYSKTISIPGTVNNNRIFGQIWNIDREILNSDSDVNTGVYFNASKRTEAKIFMDNDLFKKGYVQLNTINKTNEKITYEITFYSELCNMLHTIMDSSLGMLEFPGRLAHVINAQAIESNVGNIGPVIQNTTSYLSDYVKYGLSIDGIFDNFNADKWLTWDSTNKKYVIADIDSNGTSYDMAMLFQSPSNRIRPYIKISSLLNQIRDDYNANNSIKLSYSDPYFFNSSNPYVTKMVLSGKTYDTENNQSGTSTLSFEDFTVDKGNAVTLKATGEYADLNGAMDFSSLTVIPHITLEVMLAFNGTVNQASYQSAIKNAVYSSGRQFTVNDSITPRFYLVKLDDEGNETGAMVNFLMDNYVISDHSAADIYLGQDKDEHNTVITPLIYETTRNTNTFELAFKNCVYRDSQSYLDCSQTPCKYTETYVYDKKYTNLSSETPSSDIDNYSKDNNDNQGVTDFFPFRFTLSNLSPGKYVLKARMQSVPTYLRIRDYADYSFGDSTVNLNIETLTMRGRFNTKVGANSLVNGNSLFIYRNRQPLQSFIANTLEDTVVETTSGTNWNMSSGAGKLPGSVVTFNDMVDTETTQGDFLVNYTKLFGLVYDSDSVNEDNTIRVCTRNYYHKDYKIIDWTDKIDYSQSFKQVPLSFSTKYLTLNYNASESYYAKKYSSTYDTDYGTQLIDTGYEFNSDSSTLISNQIFNQVIPVKNEGRLRGIAPGFFDKDNNERSPIDGNYSLMFWDDDTFTQKLFIYDDNDIFHNEDIGGDENMSFVDSSSYKEHGNISLSYREVNLPAPQVICSTNSGIVSTDLGYPRSNFAGYSVSTYPSSGTIYSGYWDSYIRSLYDANTQIITVYAYLKPIEVLQFSFKNFIKIKDTLWHPNKITDYNPLSNKPVQVELVKVNDIAAYTNSSIKWYEYFKVEFNVYGTDESVKASELLLPNAGGVVTSSSANQYAGNYLYGTQWTQSFTYQQPYNGIDSIEAFYYDEFGVKQDCSSWFNVNTLTFTCEKPVPSDITVNLKVVEVGVQYYSISTLLENTALTWINPSQEVTRLRQGSTLEIQIASLYPDDDSYKFGSCVITENLQDKTSEYFDKSTMKVTVPSISGNIVITCSYLQFEDVILPWIGSGDVTGYGAYFDTGVTINPNTECYRLRGSYTASETYERLLINARYDISGGVNYFGLNFRAKTYDINVRFTNRGYVVMTNPNVDSLSYYELFTGDNTRAQSMNNYTRDWGVMDFETFGNVTGNQLTSVSNNSLLIFGKSGATAAPYSYTDLRLSFLELHSKPNLPYHRYIPMMHYGDAGYYPCLYDVYTEKYIQATYSNNLEYDMDDTSDIPLMWVGSTSILDGTSATGSCYFDTNISCEEITDASVGFEIYCSLHNTNQSDTYTLFHTRPEVVEVDEEGRHLMVTNRVEVTKNIPTMYYGAYNAGDEDIPQYEMFSIQSFKVDNDVPTRISIVPNNNTASFKVQGSSTSGTSEKILATGRENVYLFKNVNNYSSYQGMRLYSFSKFTNNGTFKYTNNLVPVAHFSGTKNEYYSQEGLKLPLGYEPCLYDTITGDYCYAAGGTPSFGWKHNS